MLFYFVDQPFEDVRIQAEDWPKEKEKLFYGKMPVLEVDGRQLFQSGAILRYLGEKFGLAGQFEWEKAKLNEIYDFHKDAYAEFVPYIYTKLGFRNDGPLDKLYEEVFKPAYKRLFPIYMKLLEQSGSGFLLPSGPTIVDFVVSDYLYTIKKMEPEVMTNYPK